MKIKKLQYGNIIPIGYTPLVAGASAPATSQSTSNTSTNKPLIDDEMIRTLSANALPSDLNVFVKDSNVFGNSIFDAGFGLENSEQRVKSLLLYMNRMQFEKKQYEDAVKHIDSINGESDIAVSPNNGVFVYRDKKLQEVSIDGLKEGETPLSNYQLLQIRANNPKAAFNSTMTKALAGATSIHEIMSFIDDRLTNLGHNKNTETQYDAIEGLEDISLEELQKMGYNQLIKSKVSNLNNINQVHTVVKSIYKQLSNSQKVLLTYQAKRYDTDPLSLILEYCSKTIKNENSVIDNLNKTGKSGKSGGSGSEKSPYDDLPFNEAMQLMLGIGFNEPINFHEGTQAQITAIGTHSAITGKNGESLGQKAATHLLNSSLAGSLDLANMSIGGAKIESTGLNHIMIRDSNAMAMDLPVTISKDGTNTIVPDWNLIQKVQEVEKVRVENNITDIAQINQLYVNANLPVKFLGLDSLGKPILNTSVYRRFVGLNVMADRKAFNEDLNIELNNRISRVTNNDRLKDFQNVMRETSYDDNFKYTDKFWFFGNPEVWNGILWTPLKTNIINAFAGAEENIDVSDAIVLDKEEQGKQTLKSAPDRYRIIDQSAFGI